MDEMSRRRIDVAALTVVECARYVLGVIDAQHVGNTSEAWNSGLRGFREALGAFDAIVAEERRVANLRHRRGRALRKIQDGIAELRAVWTEGGV